MKLHLLQQPNFKYISSIKQSHCKIYKDFHINIFFKSFIWHNRLNSKMAWSKIYHRNLCLFLSYFAFNTFFFHLRYIFVLIFLTISEEFCKDNIIGLFHFHSKTENTIFEEILYLSEAKINWRLLVIENRNKYNNNKLLGWNISCIIINNRVVILLLIPNTEFYISLINTLDLPQELLVQLCMAWGMSLDLLAEICSWTFL